MAKVRVGVLRGGPSAEHEVSLKTGENILQYLPGEKYEGIDLVLTRDGDFSANGRRARLQQLNQSVDVIFNALHGYFGEDGKLQNILNVLNIPYTGSGALVSSMAMNKVLSREIFQKFCFQVPRAFVINEGDSLNDAALKIFNSISPYWVVKPASGGSSIGVTIVKKFQDLIPAIYADLSMDSTVLVEEYIKGREVTCGILENFRGQDYYALPVIEIVPPKEREFFDYNCKYDGSTREICPADFNLAAKRKIEEIARSAHRFLGCEGYSRADMIVSPRGIYLLEVNTLPGLTSESLIPKAAQAVGLSFPNLLEHIIGLALNK